MANGRPGTFLLDEYMTLWGECERVCQSWTAGVVFQQKIYVIHPK